MNSAQNTKFGNSEEYPHAKLINSGPTSSRILRFFCGLTDIYITCLYGQQNLLLNPGIANFCVQAPKLLTGRLKRTQVIMPIEGHENEYWEDAVKLFKKQEPPEVIGHEWSKDRFFVLLTNVPPSIFSSSELPLVSIDITDITPSESMLLIVSLGPLCSKNRLIPNFHSMAENFGQALFQQDLENLSGAYQRPRENNALDILSLPALVAPSMTIDFKYFRQEIRERFDSFCEETLSSREGALPFSEILKMREEIKEICEKKNDIAPSRRKANSWILELIEATMRQFNYG